jgi:hypothetical protein
MDHIPFDEIKSHKLTSLAQKANIELSEPETFYFGILEKCSVWAGRYPLPINSEQMYVSRDSLFSREALIERTQSAIRKYMKGEIPRVECESDVLHSGIGNAEYMIYKQAKSRIMGIVDGIINAS